MLKLKLWYFDHLMQRAKSLEKTLMVGKIEGRRKREWKGMKWLDDITDSMDMNLSKFWELVKDRETWHAAVHGLTKGRMWLSNWTAVTGSQSASWHHFRKFSLYLLDLTLVSAFLTFVANLASTVHLVLAFFFFWAFKKKLFIFLLMDNCFTEFCCFLSNLNMNHHRS